MLTSKQRTAIRKFCGCSRRTNVEVKLVYGSIMPPNLIGERGGWFTRGGTRINHRGAYARKGWSNMIYSHSTEVIYVGEKWLKMVKYM